MFTSTRLKLTLWYLIIITMISVAFSIAFYKISTRELEQLRRVRGYLQEEQVIQTFPPRTPRQIIIDPAIIDEAENHLKLNLVLINLGILLASGLAGYFLAGRTLDPIKEMVSEQNRFITDASHELRTPLTSLKSGIEVNLRDKNLTLNDARKLLESNLEEVNSLQNLSDALIKLTSYKRDNQPMTDDISLLELSKEAEKKMLPIAKIKGIEIENKIKEIKFKGDLQSLKELLIIFLDNAIKYSPKKSVVTISSKKLDGHFQIIIEDQGIGIEKSDLPNLFDRFFRAEKSRTKNNTSGFGLGLSIAKRIVEEHGGNIKIDSTPQKGTTFTIELALKNYAKF